MAPKSEGSFGVSVARGVRLFLQVSCLRSGYCGGHTASAVSQSSRRYGRMRLRRGSLHRRAVEMLRRAFDIVAAGGSLVLLSPLLLCLALLVKATSPGPALYRAGRIGWRGQPFVMYKFRSMRDDASPSAPRITRAGDPRITGVGRFLRRSKLDELPQFLNVLKGDMSLVGARPQDPRYFAHYTAEQRRVFNDRPGLVGPGTIAYLNQADILEQAGANVEEYYLSAVLPDTLRLDLDYLAHRSFISDVTVIVKAAFGVLAACIARDKARLPQ